MLDDETSKRKTVPIKEVLATLPSGKPGPALTDEELTRYLQNHYKTDSEADRNKRHALRDELYRDGGEVHMRTFIDSVFADRTVRELRKKWIPYARFNNAIKRIVNELSTVYSEPARRLVTTDNDNYQKLLTAVRMDERMLEAGRLLNLHRALLLGFRVRQTPAGNREPVLDIATPANVRAVTHPNDDSLVVGWMIRTSYRTARPVADTPAWTLWTDHESLQLRDDLSVIGSSYREHKLGVCPWVPVTLGPPGPGFWPGCEGEDLVAAHVAIWFQNVLLLKESKSATKQTLLTGDGTNSARGQAGDSEVPVELPDGQTATTVDMSMDLSMFRDTNDHILNNTAHNYGMSPGIVQHQGVQSAEARDLQRLPLKEIRRQQQVPWRIAEHALALAMSAVVAVDLPDRAFSILGWRIEFAESETPLDPLSEMTLFEKRRQAGVDNTLAMLMRRFPGLDEAGAWAVITKNLEIETHRVELMKDYMAISGAMGAQTKPTDPVKNDDTVDDPSEPPQDAAA